MRFTTNLLIGVLALLASGAAAQAQPEDSPEARATWRAERLERKQQQPGAGRQQNAASRPVVISGPNPLPVEVVGSASGRPVGGNCPADESCTLSAEIPSGGSVTLTAVWSATAVECDGVTVSSPADGTPIAPGWRCSQKLVVRGKGAGYTGFQILP